MRVLVAMSGGVDSAAAAVLLARAGHECVGATLLLAEDVVAAGRADLPSAADGPDGAAAPGAPRDWDVAPAMAPHPAGPLPEPADVADAREACRALGIPHRVVDARRAFGRLVAAPFARDYEAGLTPNPCVRCNRLVKFGLLWDVARELGCDALATGHYARVERDGAGRPWVAAAADTDKDQSYVLYPVPAGVLGHLLLPLGEVADKASARALVAAAGIACARKRESQDICFVPDGDHAAFVARSAGHGPHAGRIVGPDGEVLGWHAGQERFTVGQRKGLGVSAGRRLYVTDRDAETNTVFVGDDASLFSSRLRAREAAFAPGCPAEAFRAEVVTCYHGRRHPATVTPVAPDAFEVAFDEPVRALAPGQSAVAYLGPRVACGGVIERVPGRSSRRR